MTIEHFLVMAYLAVCIGIGILASRKVLTSHDEYWVAGRRIGSFVNAMAIMAALASGGSVIGVMGLAYGRGIPYTLALFAGAVVGFPIASILIARPLRNFGKFTITDFLTFRYPHSIVRYFVPVLIVVSFTAYIVAQMKAAGITAFVLLGIPYDTAVTLAAIVFILYVSIGGMVAITWTDVVQGFLMLTIVLGTALTLMSRDGSPVTIIAKATAGAPELGEVMSQPLGSYLGSFLIWATAISVVPHIVMRVFTAKNSREARLSMNLSMIFYSVLILAAVLVIVPVGRMHFSNLQDADMIFLKVIESEFPPLIRGFAVAAVMAAVMSTTDALLLACSSAISHDLLGPFIEKRRSRKWGRWMTVAVAWIIGLLAMLFAYSPPKLITEFYSAAIGILSAALFVPTLAGLWWKKANVSGGLASLLLGTFVYAAVQFMPGTPAMSAILAALPASAFGMWFFSRFGQPNQPEMVREIEKLHES
ncbi:MAG: sodium:solute symporter family protein [Candidatus Aminicenantes bacterium]|nr:sodium:solute symporter family protein [Candidatus Aminicenantes bacterium]